MDWQKGRQSDNVEEDSGGGGSGYGGGGGGFGFRGVHLGIGGTILALLIALVVPQTRPLIFGLLFNGGGQPGALAPAARPTPGHPARLADPQQQFVAHVLGSTEDVWGSYFQSIGQTYEQPKLLLFHGATNSGCGAAQASMGPFYCPSDHRVYLDLDFFQEMDTQLHARGDFARAYVIAHEVGHHVQNLLGTMRKEQALRARGVPMDGADGLSVKVELQADCYAGVWANRSQQQLQWLQAGDVEAALNAASQVGDDTLQKSARGYAVPDSFTHGTSAQRMRWFKAGFDSGDIAHCDTFTAQAL